MDTLALSNFLKQNGVPDATTDKLIGMLQISSVISKTRPAGWNGGHGRSFSRPHNSPTKLKRGRHQMY